MSDQYIGEIRTFGFNFAPYGWFLCNGQVLSIQAYTTLFAVIGTYFGGNGTTNFQLPNLQGSVPMHWGNAQSGTVYDLGEPLGSTNVTLNSNQLPRHSHLLQDSGRQPAPPGPLRPVPSPGSATPNLEYVIFRPALPTCSCRRMRSVRTAPATCPHENMQPFLTINFCIAYMGALPVAQLNGRHS